MRRLFSLLIPVFLSAYWGLTTLPAQQKPADQAGDIPVFKTSSNLVLVSVYVRGKDGKPVENLKPEDFTILENGKQQAISVFDYQRLTEGETKPEEKKLEVRAAPATKPVEAAAPATTSVRFKDKRLLVLYIDWTSMDPAQQLRAKEGAEKAIREQLGPGDLMALLSFGNSVVVDQELTDDKDLMLTALARHTPGLSPDMTQVVDDNDDSNADSAQFTADNSEFNLFTTDRRMAALEEAARHYGALPEKKALIWFTSDAGASGQDNLAWIRSASNVAVRSNVSIYPVDVRGLQATIPGGDASTATPRGANLFSGRQQNTERDRFTGSQDTLVTVAEETGGKALIDNNDLGAGVTLAKRDLRSYYVLGYYSSDDRRDGKYRKVDVKLNPKIAASVDYRSGYYADAEFKAMGSEGREKQLQDAMLLGDPVTDLPLAVEINWFRHGANNWFVPVAVKIPGTEIPLRKKGSAEEMTSFDFLGEVRNAKNAQVAMVRDNIKIRLRDEQTGTLKSKNLLYETGFQLAPGPYHLKMLVRENETGKMGTYETIFQVPQYGPKDFPRSSVVLTAQREAASAAAIAAAGKKVSKGAQSHPLIVGDKRLVPSVTHVFRRTQTLAALVEIYDLQPPLSVAATLSLFDSAGKKVFESAPARPDSGRLLIETPLKSLAPGRYIAQLNMIDFGGQKFAFPRSPLTVH
ncbi:MAG: VWA domain-containing protein [Bryobacteraceae bacterium]